MSRSRLKFAWVSKFGALCHDAVEVLRVALGEPDRDPAAHRLAADDGAPWLADVFLEPAEDGELIRWRGVVLPAGPVPLIPRASERVAPVEQPRLGLRMVGQWNARGRPFRGEVAVAVEDQGAVPVRWHLYTEVRAIDRAGVAVRDRWRVARRSVRCCWR